MDKAFIQRMHDNYSLQTKTQKPADKTLCETLGEFVALVIVLRFILVYKKWSLSRTHMRLIVTMAL